MADAAIELSGSAITAPVATVSPTDLDATPDTSSQETDMPDTSIVEPTTSTITSSTSAPKSTTSLVTTTTAKIQTEISAAVALHFTYETTSGFGVRNPYIAAWVEDSNGEMVKTLLLLFEQSSKGER